MSNLSRGFFNYFKGERQMVQATDNASRTINRRELLRQAGRGAAGLAAGLSAADFLIACGGGSGGSSSANPQSITVAYWSNVSPKQNLFAIFNGFTKKYGVKVNYFQEPQVFGDTVQKLTTYLSSGYTGIDVLWIDDFMTATFGTANWLLPLGSRLPANDFSSVTPAQLKLSTYNGQRYRLPANFGAVIFFYRQDLFDRAGVSVPTTWDELVQVGQKVTGNGVYGIGIAGKSGNGELFNEMCYWMRQAGADPFHLKTPGARQALKFVYDLIHTYKIAPPDTITNDYTALTTAFESGKLAMWATWDGIYAGIDTFPSVSKNGYKLGVAYPPKGPVNNSTIIANWGWSINKYSKYPDMAAKFIDYAASMPSEITLAQTGSTPARTDALSDPGVQKTLIQTKNLVDYVHNVELSYRPITAQIQRLSDAFEAPINKYLNNQIDLDTAINQGQQAIDQIMQGS
jgi:multiple sugar transport system substrate-binding protein